MQLEVGKKYVLDSGTKTPVIGRCICADKKGRGGEVFALFLYEWTDGAEHLLATRADGGAYGGVSVVKEYVPPMRVRLVIMRSGVSTVSLTAFEDQPAFASPKWPTDVYSLSHWTRLSDTIVEVPINGQAGA